MKLSLFRDLLTALAPVILATVPGAQKLAPHVEKITDAIGQAQAIKGATGPEKRAHVIAIVKDGAGVAAGAGAHVDPEELGAIAGHGIDAVIGAINAVKKAHVEVHGADVDADDDETPAAGRAVDPASLEGTLPPAVEHGDPAPAESENR